MKTRIVAAVVALMAMACERERRSPAGLGTQIRDSAGICVVENARPDEGSRLDWRIGPEPAVSIGELEGEEPYLLHLAMDATRLSDGRIVVVNAGTRQLRVFDGSGTHVATWGGEGEGPGEFGEVSSIAPLRDDSVIAWGRWDATMTVFDRGGKFARRLLLDRSRIEQMPFHFTPLSVTRDGSILASQDLRPLDSAAAEVWDAEGGLQGFLGKHPS